jgi:hypothetical protein
VKTLCMTTLLGWAAIISLGSSNAYAQFEIDPDHFETKEPEPLKPSKAGTPTPPAKVHYAGSFTLPYTLECNHRSLPPGKYSVSVDSDGRTALVTVNRKGAPVTLQGVERKQNRYWGREALVVERNEGIRHLSAIHLTEFDLTFRADARTQSAGKSRNLEEVALILLKPRE